MKPTLTPADFQSLRVIIQDEMPARKGHRLYDYDLELVILSAMFEGFRPTAPLQAGDFFSHAHQVLFDGLNLSFEKDVARTPEFLVKCLRAGTVAATPEQMIEICENVMGTPFALHLDWAANEIVRLSKRRRALAWIFRLEIILEDPNSDHSQVDAAWQKLKELMP